MRHLVLATLAALLACSATAQERFAISESQMQRFSRCSSTSQWSVAVAPRVCTEEPCLETEGEYELFESPRCGSGMSQCLVPSGTDPDIYPSHEVIYRPPYPGFYSAAGGVEQMYRLPTERNIRDLAFVPAAQAVRGADFAEIEAAIEADDNALTFVDMMIRRQNGQVDEGRALCRANTDLGGPLVPRNCVVTRINRDGVNYLLAELGRMIDFSECAQASLRATGTFFAFEPDIPPQDFAGRIMERLVAEGIRLDRTTLEPVYGDRNFVLLASAGPRVSVVDRRLRERVDVSLTGRFYRGAPRTGDNTQRPARSTFQFTTRLSAWTGRQQEAEGVWAWPSDAYYAELGNMLENSIQAAFTDMCTELGLGITDEIGSGINTFICQ